MLYKTDFEMDKMKKKYIRKNLKKGNFYKNKDGIVLSREFPKKEACEIDYNEGEGGWYVDKYRKYYEDTISLCKKHNKLFTNVLEVGAGYGYFFDLFIKAFKPHRYTMYEFTYRVDVIKQKIDKMDTDTKIEIFKKSFKNITKEQLKKYDCIFALEVLEHISWDKKFLHKLYKDQWIFFSVPIFQAYNHVRAFLTPDSIVHRYSNLLNIHEIFACYKTKEKKPKEIKLKHYYPYWWIVVAQKK